MSESDWWERLQVAQADVERSYSGTTGYWLNAYLAAGSLVLALLEEAQLAGAMLVLILALNLGTIWERRRRLREVSEAAMRERSSG